MSGWEGKTSDCNYIYVPIYLAPSFTRWLYDIGYICHITYFTYTLPYIYIYTYIIYVMSLLTSTSTFLGVVSQIRVYAS